MTDLEYYERLYESEPSHISLRLDLSRRIGPYNDKNDGFCRTLFSRSKRNHAKIRKVGKRDKKNAFRLVGKDPALLAALR